MHVYLEYVYHFQCDFCKQLWTCSDLRPDLKQTVYCTHCGNKNTVDAIEVSPANLKPSLKEAVS